MKYGGRKMNENFLAEAALAALSDLGEARQDWVSATIEMAGTKKDLALANATARQQITAAAGGAKALGSNADLREIALIAALEGDWGYMTALASHDKAFEQEARAKQAMYTLNDTLNLFKVFLEMDAFADPAGE
jgi:hypothetical protein